MHMENIVTKGVQAPQSQHSLEPCSGTKAFLSQEGFTLEFSCLIPFFWQEQLSRWRRLSRVEVPINPERRECWGRDGISWEEAAAEEEEGGWADHGGYGREGAPVTEPWTGGWGSLSVQGLNFGSGELEQGAGLLHSFAFISLKSGWISSALMRI